MPDEPLSDPTPYDVAPEPKPEAAAKPAPFVPPVPIFEPAESDPDEQAAMADAVKGRGPAILGYTIFLIPLLLAPRSRFARYHANQALLLFITGMIVLVILLIGAAIYPMVDAYLGKTLGVIGALLTCGWYVLQAGAGLGLIMLAIMGIINAANLEKKPLPLIGHFTLIHEEINPQIDADKRG